MKTQSLNQINKIEHLGNGFYHYNFNIAQVEIDTEEGLILVWEANYVKVKNPHNSSEVITAIIRAQFSQDEVEAILSNYLTDDIKSFLTFNNFRKYAKAIAIGASDDAIQLIKTATHYEVKLPLNEILEGGIFNLLANKSLKLGIPSISDPIDNSIFVYPAFILEEDLNTLNQHPNVSVTQFSLFPFEGY